MEKIKLNFNCSYLLEKRHIRVFIPDELEEVCPRDLEQMSGQEIVDKIMTGEWELDFIGTYKQAIDGTEEQELSVVADE